MALTKRQREHLEKRLREERERVLRALGQYNTELADAEQEAAAVGPAEPLLNLVRVFKFDRPPP